MEHLLLPRGAVVEEYEKAPYIAEKYDGGSFLDYPDRSRFKDLYQVIWPPIQNIPSEDLTLDEDERSSSEVFLQTWLVFGLLHEVFGELVSVDDFVVSIVEEHGVIKRLLTSVKLPSVVEAWVKRNYDNPDEDEKKRRLEHLIACLMLAYRVLREAPTFVGINPSILWTAASIGETIEGVVLRTLDITRIRRISSNWKNIFDSDDIQARLVSNGWCPTDVAIWRASSSGFQRLYYLSKIKQPVLRDHSNCVGTACVAYQFDMSNKNAIHRCQAGDCGMIHADGDALRASLEDGFIALLDIQGMEDPATMTVDVICSKYNKGYVALSHVWADGLGNPVANSLPRCQLSYLGNTVKQLGEACGNPHLLLWLDTLCCPVASLEHQRRCLVLMRQIYEQADHVLILDAQLNKFTTRELDAVEICARMMYSAWTRRLWTLQEGALADRLWVQMEDGSVDLDLILADLTHVFRTHFIRSQFMLNLAGELNTLRELVSQGPGRGSRDITDLAKAIANRSVTVASDEPLCLCTCMNLEQSTVVNVGENERMKAFWTALALTDNVIPKNIIFFTGPRLPFMGVRWAPASFLGSNYFYSFQTPESADQVASIGPDGLSANFPAFEYSSSYSTSLIEESQITVALEELRFHRLAKLSEDEWLLIMPEKQTEVSDNQRPIFILEESIEDIKDTIDTIYGQRTTNSVVSVFDETGNSGAIVHPTFSARIILLDPGMASTLEAVLHHGRDLNPTSWSLLDDEESERQSPMQMSHWLDRLPTRISRKLFEVARVAFEEDLTLFPKLSGLGIEQSGDPFNYAQNTFSEILLFYLGGRFGEVTRVWPKDQRWCLR